MAKRILLMEFTSIPTIGRLHRLARIARYLPEYGWEPEILTIGYTREIHPPFRYTVVRQGYVRCYARPMESGKDKARLYDLTERFFYRIGKGTHQSLAPHSFERILIDAGRDYSNVNLST